MTAAANPLPAPLFPAPPATAGPSFGTPSATPGAPSFVTPPVTAGPPSFAPPSAGSAVPPAPATTPFPSAPPATTGTPASSAESPPSWAAAPVSAPPPPAVPAPALPTWPPPATPARDADATRPVRQQSGSTDLAGAVYGGGTDGPGFATVSFPQGNPLENSGSLTGHILAQGWSEESPAARGGNTKVIIVLAVALTMLIAISLLVVFLANDALSGLTGAMPVE
ncbi:serine/arginine repetitive matrix protein 2 [Micromonospora sp. M42]|nr:serine/arginine repetitive matrix protein 2 [Micromonospora sp. M42]